MAGWKKTGFKDLRFHSTFDIIEAVEGGRFPERVMMTFHPQGWTDRPLPWVRELVWQNVKNLLKRAMLIRRLHRLTQIKGKGMTA